MTSSTYMKQNNNNEPQLKMALNLTPTSDTSGFSSPVRKLLKASPQRSKWESALHLYFCH